MWLIELRWMVTLREIVGQKEGEGRMPKVVVQRALYSLDAGCGMEVKKTYSFSGLNP